MGIWIKSQDKTIVTHCRSIKVWESGRVVNALGREYIHLGDYATKERGIEVLGLIAKHIESGSDEIFEMPSK
nr:hypothetical protein [uncultured Cellulosilyticum sp.]